MFHFIIRFQKSDIIRELLSILFLIAIYSGIDTYLEIEYFKLTETSHIKNLSVIHITFCSVIFLLLAYRINYAYDRWWEGRNYGVLKLITAENLAIKLSVILKVEKDLAYFRILILSYATMLIKHLKVKKRVCSCLSTLI